MKLKAKPAAALTILLGISFSAGVYADTVIQKVDAYLRPDFKVIVDGKLAALTSPALIYDGSSYLPLKAIAKELGAQVNWDEATKSIYVNRIIYPNQQPNDTENTLTQEFTMRAPRAQTVQYLGKYYTLLLVYGDRGGTFYRVGDAQKMGIQTNGLRKAKDSYSGELFIDEEELKKAWKETPKPSYMPGDYANAAPMGQITDSKKIEALNTFVKTLQSFQLGDKLYSTSPILMEQGESDMDYVYWCMLNGRIARYRVFLKQEKVDVPGKEPELKYAIVGSSQTYLEPETFYPPY